MVQLSVQDITKESKVYSQKKFFTIDVDCVSLIFILYTSGTL